MEEYINGVRGIIYVKKENSIKYILVKSKRGVISFPGGGVEENDKSLDDAIMREIKEETGLTPKDYNLKKTDIIDEFVYDKSKEERSGKMSKQQVYLIETNKNIFKPQEEAEIKGSYTEKEVLENLTFDTSKNIFKKAIKLLK